VWQFMHLRCVQPSWHILAIHPSNGKHTEMDIYQWLLRYTIYPNITLESFHHSSCEQLWQIFSHFNTYQYVHILLLCSIK
jgi:hypothetical protein